MVQEVLRALVPAARSCKFPIIRKFSPSRSVRQATPDAIAVHHGLLKPVPLSHARGAKWCKRWGKRPQNIHHRTQRVAKELPNGTAQDHTPYGTKLYPPWGWTTSPWFSSRADRGFALRPAPMLEGSKTFLGVWKTKNSS